MTTVGDRSLSNGTRSQMGFLTEKNGKIRLSKKFPKNLDKPAIPISSTCTQYTLWMSASNSSVTRARPASVGTFTHLAIASVCDSLSGRALGQDRRVSGSTGTWGVGLSVRRRSARYKDGAFRPRMESEQTLSRLTLSSSESSITTRCFPSIPGMLSGILFEFGFFIFGEILPTHNVVHDASHIAHDVTRREHGRRLWTSLTFDCRPGGGFACVNWKYL